jgi:hypothetical protein
VKINQAIKAKKISSADYADYTDFKKFKAVNNGVMYPFGLLTALKCFKDGMVLKE